MPTLSGRNSSRRRFFVSPSATKADWLTAHNTNSLRSGLLVTPTELPFEQVWFVDFEFVSKPGEHPDVVCLVAREMRSGQTLRLWRDQLGPTPPYRTDADVLFVCFVANAECACHLALGWPLPAKILDFSPPSAWAANGPPQLEARGFLARPPFYASASTGAKR